MSDVSWSEWKQIGVTAGGFPPEAVQFVRDGLQHTVKLIHGEAVATAPILNETDEQSRHVTGQQLCLGLRDYALRRYGMLARSVLAKWNVQRTEDFGRIVFAMVDADKMRKNDGDSLADFENVFDFDEAFSNFQVK